MPTISPTTSAAVAAESGRSSQVLDTQDFLQIMITELTNQDPFEPMKNQDLLNQMSTIQQLQSNQNMNQSFAQMIDRQILSDESMAGSFGEMLDKFDGFLSQQRLTDATGMIGQMVAGMTPSGSLAYGLVTAVHMDGETVRLELDNGWTIDMDSVTALGGTSTQDLVGNLVMGAAANGSYVVGIVESVELSEEGALLNLVNSEEQLPLAGAVPLNEESAVSLIGLHVAGTDDGIELEGIVESVSFTAEDTMLNLKNGTQLPLSALTQVLATAS